MGQSLKVTRKPFSSKHHPQLKWVVYWPSEQPGEPRLSRRFKTKAAADRFADKKAVEVATHGRRAAAIRETVMQDALWATGVLRPCGVTLREVVEDYLRRREGAGRSKPLKEAVEDFLLAKRQDGRSVRYVFDLKTRLGRLASHQGEDGRAFGDRMVSDFGTREIDAWLRGLMALEKRSGKVKLDRETGEPCELDAVSRNNFRRVAVVFFSWAQSLGYCDQNPVQGVALAKELDKRVEVFTPEELRVILDFAPEGLVPFLALGAFAGLRTAEISRLRWRSVNFRKERIEVDAETSKTAAHRFVPMQAVLRAWLEPAATGKREDEPVCPVNVTAKLWHYHQSIEQPEEGVRPGVVWKSNALRHSYASYSLALTEDAGRVAAWLGHQSPAMTFKHYRERVEKEDAVRWFEVFPEARDARLCLCRTDFNQKG